MPKGIYQRGPTVGGGVKAAIAALLGPPIGVENLAGVGQGAKLLLLKEQLGRLATPKEYSAFSTDFTRFLLEKVWTKDEARGGRVARIPDYPFLKDLASDFVTERKLFVEKSRRVLATWTACAFDVWLAAGGQDARWPALMNARGNRQIFLCHRKFEDSNKYLRERVWYIIRELMDRGIRDDWPDFPTWSWKEGEIAASNGSLITAVAQGSDQLRGFAATLLHCEEISFWESARATIESALPTLRGGGHIVAITTANANSYASEIRNGRLRTGWQMGMS